MAGVGERDVWVRPTDRSDLATVGEQLDLAGRLINPASTVVIRVRYLKEVVLDSRFRDPEGRVWRVQETREVGRRRYLDVAVSTYDTLAPPNTAAFNPPAGWYLQQRREGGVDKFATSGNYIAQLTVRATQVDSGRRLFDVLIPSPGYAVARGLPQWLIDPTTQTNDFGRVTITGGSIPITGVTGANAITVVPNQARDVANNEFDSGLNFPTFSGGAFWLLPSGFAIPALSPGDVITIAPAS